MNSLLTILSTMALLVIALACGPTPSGPMDSPSTMTPTVIPVSPTDTPTPTPAPVPTPTNTPVPPPPTPTPVEGPGYGGFFIDPEDDSIVYIYLVNPSQEGAEWIGRTRISNVVYKGTKKFREVRPIQGRYTYHQLYKWHRKQLGTVVGHFPEWTLSGACFNLVGSRQLLSAPHSSRPRARFLQTSLDIFTYQIETGSSVRR